MKLTSCYTSIKPSLNFDVLTFTFNGITEFVQILNIIQIAINEINHNI